MKQYAYFNELPVGTVFFINGDSYKKQSSRTAYFDYAKKWFYMQMKTLCVVGQYSRVG
jgi:hypothetical protein